MASAESNALQIYINYNNNVADTEKLKSQYKYTYHILLEGECYKQSKGFVSYATNLFRYDTPAFNSVLDMIEFASNKDELIAFNYAFERYKRTRTIIDMNVAWKIALDVIGKNNAQLTNTLKQNFNCGTNKLAKKMLDLMVKKLDPNNYDENIRLVLDRYFQIEIIRNMVIGQPKPETPKEVREPYIIYVNDFSNFLTDNDKNIILALDDSFQIVNSNNPVPDKLYLYVQIYRETDSTAVDIMVGRILPVTKKLIYLYMEKDKDIFGWEKKRVSNRGLGTNMKNLQEWRKDTDDVAFTKLLYKEGKIITKGERWDELLKFLKDNYSSQTNR